MAKPESLLITSHPNDEMAEIWDGIVTQLADRLRDRDRSLSHYDHGRRPGAGADPDAVGGDDEIEAGSYDTRVKPDGPPELAAICNKLNHLAATLGDAVDDKRRLAERVVSLQDVERKEIARELHDEFGPYLFALRAHASALTRIADAGEPNVEVLRKHGSAILEQVNALQQSNRRVLEKLRPVGLTELGLREALGALLRLWRESHPGVVIETAISPSLGDTGETADLTIYRTIQEALTNVFRHAGATSVNVTVEPTELPSGLARAGRGGALVRVRDNGSGLRAGSQAWPRPDRNARAHIGAGRLAHGRLRGRRRNGRGRGSQRRASLLIGNFSRLFGKITAMEPDVLNGAQLSPAH